jgi:hypothetical protein
MHDAVLDPRRCISVRFRERGKPADAAFESSLTVILPRTRDHARWDRRSW